MAGKSYTTKEYMGIIQMWKDGKTAREIADKFGRTVAAIRCVLSVHRREVDPTLRRVNKKVNSWTTATCKRFAEMWKAGATLEEIAAAFGISVHTIPWRATCIRQEYGVKFLPYRREFIKEREV